MVIATFGRADLHKPISESPKNSISLAGLSSDAPRFVGMTGLATPPIARGHPPRSARLPPSRHPTHPARQGDRHARARA